MFIKNHAKNSNGAWQVAVILPDVTSESINPQFTVQQIRKVKPV
jgi:hypothetical protein